MGPVAALVTLALFAALVYLLIRLWGADPRMDSEYIWPGRIGVTFAVIVLGVHLINAYVVPVPLMFAPRTIDVPAASPAPAKVPDLRIAAPPKPGPTAAEEHRSAVKAWRDLP